MRCSSLFVESSWLTYFKRVGALPAGNFQLHIVCRILESSEGIDSAEHVLEDCVKYDFTREAYLRMLGKNELLEAELMEKGNLSIFCEYAKAILKEKELMEAFQEGMEVEEL